MPLAFRSKLIRKNVLLDELRTLTNAEIRLLKKELISSLKSMEDHLFREIYNKNFNNLVQKKITWEDYKSIVSTAKKQTVENEDFRFITSEESQPKVTSCDPDWHARIKKKQEISRAFLEEIEEMAVYIKKRNQFY